MKAYSVIALMGMLALGGCGAGSSDVQVPDYSAAIKQAATNYAATIPKITPPPPINPTLPVVSVPQTNNTPYTSAHVIAEGFDMGIIDGKSDVEIVTMIANMAIADPAKYQPLYKLLLSAEGMHFTVQSNRAYVATKYVAKLTPSGLVVGMV